MFRSALRHGTLRTVLAASAAVLAVAPAAAQAQRPLATSIVEYGGIGNSATVFVHGTHGHNNFVVDWAEEHILVRSLTGERITAGHGCGWHERLRAVACRTPFKVVVNLHGAGDEARVREIVRHKSLVEVWGGQDNDKLVTESGPKQAILLGGDDHDMLIGSESREGLFGGPGSDVIRPGGGPDHIDGGHGEFNGGSPWIRSYVQNDGECAARTHGFWDRAYPNVDGPEGTDTLDLSGLYQGALADLNVCRLGWHSSAQPGLVHAIENVIGTPYNDRLVGDGDTNSLNAGAGNDWVTGEGGADRITTADNGFDTVKCSDGGDTYDVDYWDTRLGC